MKYHLLLKGGGVVHIAIGHDETILGTIWEKNGSRDERGYKK